MMNLFSKHLSDISKRSLPFKSLCIFFFPLTVLISGLFFNFRCFLAFQKWLASCSLYGIFRDIVRAPNGNLEPIKYLLGQTAFMNYALAAINEISRIRVYGIEIRPVVDYYFPLIHRLCIQFIFHTFFSISGHFACLKDRGFIAALCFIGMLSCLLYTIWMFYTLFPFAQKKKYLVQKYICKKHDLDKSASKKLPLSSDENMEKHIMELAAYIGQQWNKSHIKHIGAFPKDSIEKTFVLLVQKSLDNSFYYFLKNASESSSAESDHISSVVISDGFAAFFPNTLKGVPRELIDSNVKTAEYILYVGYIPPPLKNNLEVARFQKMCRHCKSIWKQLLYTMDDTYQRCCLTYGILQDSLSVDKQLFTLMVCGLLQYFWSFALRTSDNEIQAAQQTRTFLFTLQEIDLHSTPEKQLSEQVAEILYIAAGMIQWSAFLGTLPDSDRELETFFIFKRISLMELSYSAHFKLHKNQNVYSIYAFLLLSFEHSDALKHLSVRIIQNVQQAIQEDYAEKLFTENISVRRPYDE